MTLRRSCSVGGVVPPHLRDLAIELEHEHLQGRQASRNRVLSTNVALEADAGAPSVSPTVRPYEIA